MGKSWKHGILYTDTYPGIFSEFGILCAWGEILIGGDANLYSIAFYILFEFHIYGAKSYVLHIGILRA